MCESVKIVFKCIYGGIHPVIGEVWHRVATAHGGDKKRYQRYLCDALTMMVHDSSECIKVIELLDSVTLGQVAEESYGKNDTCVTFRGNIAQVDILIEDEIETAAARFDLKEYRKVLCAWNEFLLMPEAMETIHGVQLE